MSEREAFMRAVIAEPDDDLPRLIFADWLDEHGEPEWAEFIRVQCELATLQPPGFPRRPDQPGYIRESCLRRRERELLTFSRYTPLLGGRAGSVGEAWLPPFMMDVIVPPAGSHSVWRRGFLTELSCRWEDFARRHAAILESCPIRDAKDGLVRLTTSPEPEVRYATGAPTILRLPGGRWYTQKELFDLAAKHGPFRNAVEWLLAAEFPGVHFDFPLRPWGIDAWLQGQPATGHISQQGPGLQNAPRPQL